jgi:hypothetical protein
VGLRKVIVRPDESAGESAEFKAELDGVARKRGAKRRLRVGVDRAGLSARVTRVLKGAPRPTATAASRVRPPPPAVNKSHLTSNPRAGTGD